METNETKSLNRLKELTALYFKTLQLSSEKPKEYTAPIKVVNYFELGCIITDLLKLCILALNHDVNSEKDKTKSIDVALVLETVLSIFPLDEMEFLGYITEVVGE